MNLQEEIGDLFYDLFAVADHKCVNERDERQGIYGTRAPGDHNRVSVFPLG